MARFVIECPQCGNYVEAKTGFFAKKSVACGCGHTFEVKTNRMSLRKCAHCGNEVAFDQGKGKKAKCPVCHNSINELGDISKLVEFSCEQCGIRLSSDKNARVFTCPVCDHVNDVQSCITKEKIKKSGLASVIKYEGDNETLIWKHPIEDFNLGSQLIVHESQEAIFFKDGQALDLFGAGRYTLETHQLPILEKLYKLPTDTTGTFHSEVYYINLTTQMGIKWGTDSKVRLFDPASGMHLEIGASGEFNIHVINSRKLLIKLVGTTSGMTQDELLGIGTGKGYFRAMVMTQVKSFLAQTIKENSLNILEIDYHLMTLSESLKERINVALSDYGLEMTEFYVNNILTPDSDPNFKRMKQQYADRYLKVREEQIKKDEAEAAAERKTVEAQTAARLKIIGAQGDAEAYKLKAAAEAEEMKMKGYTYQQETSRMVGMEAMQNGITGGDDLGGGLGNIAGLGISLGAMGSVVGMTRDALNPVVESSKEIGQTIGNTIEDTWDCPQCGMKRLSYQFCPSCGMKRIEQKTADGWNCAACGAKNITSLFCPECGAKKPENGWVCPNCGTKGIISRFCPDCGTKKPVMDSGWNCPECGTKSIMTNFCPNCGKKKGE